MIEAFELHAQNGGVQSIEPTIASAHAMAVAIALRPSMIGVPAYFCGERGIVSDHSPAVAQRAEVFPRIEAEPRRYTDTSGSAALKSGPVSLGRILD